MNPANYQSHIATELGVPAARAEAIAAAYPLAAYPTPIVALSTLDSDANFACPAMQVDRWTSGHVPTFGYEFNDGLAPQRWTTRRAAPFRHPLARAAVPVRPPEPRFPGISTPIRRSSPPECAQHG